MTELLSDEEDQEAIEADPNTLYIQNKLELLSLRARKQEPSAVQTIQRLEKRSRVIEQQLMFDKKFAHKEVQKAVKAGHLRPKKEASSESDSDSEDGWLAVQPNGKQAPAVETPEVESVPISTVQSDDDLIISDIFDDPSPEPVAELDQPEEVDNRTLFPLVLPRTSQNISPVSLLRSQMKKIDKQSKDEFVKDVLILTFSSRKVEQSEVVLEEQFYRFPDRDTARNYLSMKALFSVPELGSQKAGVRFSGVFKSAWQLLEDEGSEIQKRLIAGKVQNVRDIYAQRAARAVKATQPQELIQTEQAPVYRRDRDLIDFDLDEIWIQTCTSESYYNMLAYRHTLPIALYRDALLDSINHNQVTIVCGETGCGKSTQLPTFILEYCLSQSRACRIYVTEPRRISAISLATRVSAELGEPKKAIANGDSLLGFSIRLDSQVSDKSRLIYATTGIVLRMLEENNDLGGITHLIIDEVHERSIESDFLLIVVKRLLQQRRDLKVVLMSATLQSERFNEYFGGHCSIFNVPGRTFPVEQRFLEDAIELSGYTCDDTSFYAKRGRIADLDTNWEIPDDDDIEDNEDDLITYSERTTDALRIMDPYKVNFDLIFQLLNLLANAVDRSCTQAILVFLPGLGEIRRLLDTLQAHKHFGDNRKWVIYALHSSVSSDKQQAAFDVPPHGVRKIVLATNIAETGITIPDITCVIDAGKHKESRFDARRQLSKLVECFISRSNAKQRMGRAGRVQPGLCFHLFSRARYNKMEEHQLPEFQRLNLDELALRVKVVGMGEIETTLLEALDAPTPENVKRSINNLIQVGALDESQNLTQLGRHLAKLPVEATLGKLILFGLRHQCLDPCLVIAATLSSKSPFENPIGKEREANAAKQTFVRGDSDFIAMWTAYSKWRTVAMDKPQHEYKFCKESYLSTKGLSAIEELRLQYIKVLIDSGLLTVSDSDRRTIHRARFASSRDGFVILPRDIDCNSTIHTYIETCLASAFYPNLLNIEDFRTIAKGQPVTIHSSSCNSTNKNFQKRWIVYYNLLKTKIATNAHDTGLVDDYIVALTCGTHFEVNPFSGTLSIDHNRIKFKTRDLRTLVAITVLRKQLELEFTMLLRGGQGDITGDLLCDLIRTVEAAVKLK